MFFRTGFGSWLDTHDEALLVHTWHTVAPITWQPRDMEHSGKEVQGLVTFKLISILRLKVYCHVTPNNYKLMHFFSYNCRNVSVLTTILLILLCRNDVNGSGNWYNAIARHLRKNAGSNCTQYYRPTDIYIISCFSGWMNRKMQLAQVSI